MDRIRHLLRLSPLRIAGAYLVFGVLWILYSDRLVERIAANAAQLTQLQTIKGWLFVVASAVVIYVLVRAGLRQLLATASRLRDSEARLRQFATVTTEGLLFVEGTRVTDVNDAVERLAGVSRRQLQGRPLAELVTDADRPRLAALLAAPDGASGELRLATGRPVEVSVRAVTQDGRSRQILRMRDLGHERELELQLRQAQKLEAVALLTAGIAHDFNNILSVILANAELLQRVLPADRPELHEGVADLRQAALSGSGMVRRLLGFSRQATLSLQPTDLQLVVTDIGAMMARLLPATIQVRIAADTAVPSVQADATAVQQVLLNLGTNARDAMPEGGRLELTLEPVQLDDDYCATHPWVEPGRYVCLTVADTGVGMSEELQARAFDPFFTTKDVGKGTGLGLAMVYGLMKQQGGHIDLDSAPGRGTRVSVYFPVPHDASRRAVTAPAGGAPRGGSETVLLVEDDPVLRRTGRRVLEVLGYHALTAANGLEALQMLQQAGTRADLVLCDISMPEMGGIELYRALREGGNPPRFVFASGYAAQQMVEALGEQVESLLWIQKPWTIEDLAAMLRRALDARAPEPG
jgi:PAS domain S-box-containing protein